MNRALVVAAFLVLPLIMPGATAVPPSVDAIDVTVNGAAPGTLELISSGGQINTNTVDFSVSASGDVTVAEIRLTPGCPVPVSPICKLILVPLNDADGDGTWNGSIGINDVRLVATDWTVTARAIGSDGINDKTATDPLKVRATHDTGAPTIEVVGAQASRVEIGIGQSIQLTPQDPLLGLVQMESASIGAAVKILSPYNLDNDLFAEGSESVTFRAIDRALRTTTTVVTVHKDTTDPVVSVSTPDAAYRDVAFNVVVAVEEFSSHNVTVEFDGNESFSDQSVHPTGSVNHAFAFTVDEPGLYNGTVFVVDSLGNSEGHSFNVTVTQPFADLGIDFITTSPEHPLAGEPVDVAVGVTQGSGVKAQATTVRLSVGEFEHVSKGSNLAVGQTKTVDYTVRPVVGKHLLVANISLDDSQSIESDLSNNTLNTTFEVFLGRVTFGTHQFHIRVGDDGLPLEAVGSNGTTYALTLEEITDGEVWAFEVDGEGLWAYGTVKLHWDPTQQITNIPLPTTTEPEDTQPTPGIALPLLVAGLAVALLARRR